LLLHMVLIPDSCDDGSTAPPIKVVNAQLWLLKQLDVGHTVVPAP
jgi:hypothetical protein